MPTLTLLDDAMLRAARMVPAIHRLGGGTIAMAGSSQPWRVIGTDAVVYQLRLTNGRVVALRCLMSDAPAAGVVDRYRALSADGVLRRLRAGADTPIVGHLAVIADGISLPASDFRSVHLPIVAMDWVMGPTLIAAVDRACRAREGEALADLCRAWQTAVTALDAVGFVHGNLTADNALVSPGEGIMLVDYDTASWPGAPPFTVPDAVPGYRHPRGAPGDDARRDDFAALVVYTSLRVLAQWPDLREEHGDRASQHGGTLLFGARDLAHPDGSTLFAKLRSIDDAEVQALVGILRETCRLRPDDVPPFREAIAAAVNVSRQAPVARPTPLVDQRERQQRLARLNSLLLDGDDDGARRFWRSSGLVDDPEAARQLGPRMAEIERRQALRSTRQAGETDDRAAAVERWEAARLSDSPHAAPAHPVVDHAQRRTDAVARLERALAGRDAAAVAQLWPQVRSEPQASRFAAQAYEVVSKLLGAAIAGAIDRGDDQAIVQAVKDAERSGVAVGVPGRQAARAAAGRLDARGKLREALRVDDRDAIADLALSGALDEMGEFDQETTRQIIRALATPHLLRAIATDDDLAIYNAFDEGVFGGFAGIPADHVDRVHLAVRRVRWLRSVRDALKQRDVAALKRAIVDEPPAASERLSPTETARIERLLRQDEALAELAVAMRSGDDVRIVDALNEVEAAGATLPETLNWDAVRSVIDRLSLVASIRRAAFADPPDYQRLSRLLAQARNEATDETPYLGPNLDFVELEQDVWRAAHRARVREALRHGDDKAIVAAALPDLYGAIPTLQPSEQLSVRRAISNHRGAGPLGPNPLREAASTR